MISQLSLKSCSYLIGYVEQVGLEDDCSRFVHTSADQEVAALPQLWSLHYHLDVLKFDDLFA